MKKKLVWLVVSCLMVTALLLASCAPATAPTPTLTPTPTPMPTPTLTPTPAPGPEVPKYGGVLTYALVSPPAGFDEVFIRPSNNFSNRLTHEELVGGDWARGPAGTGEIKWLYSGFPGVKFLTDQLCTNWELTDPQTLVFHIRKGVRFGLNPNNEASRLVNGREMDANDVVYSIKRLFDASASYVAKNHPAGLEALYAPDKWTVIMKCPKGDTGPLFQDVGAQVIVIPHEVIEKYADMRDWKNVVGTGPFLLTDYIAQASLTFARNPNYWGKDTLHPDNQLPYLDSIKWLIMPDASTQIAALRTGKIDQRMSVSWEDAQSLPRTTPQLKSVEALGDRAPGNVTPIFWRVDKPELPFHNIRVRQALIMAIDFRSIVKDYFGGHAEMLAFPSAPVPDYGDVYVPMDKQPVVVQELYSYNVEKAKKLLAEAGYPTGFKTEIVCTQRFVDKLSIIKDYWAKLGVDLKLDVKEETVWTSIMSARTHKEMIVGERGFASLFKMLSERPTAANNYSFISDQRNEEVYQQVAANFFNETDRDRVYREWVPYCLEQAWFFAFPTEYRSTFWWPWLKNYHGEYSVGYSDHENWGKWVWIDQSLKTEITGSK